jgi:hypothetical protein
MVGKLISLGQRLLINSNENSIRKGIVFCVSYLLLFFSLLFSVEIALILLGIGDIILPWTTKALEIINRLVF